MTFRTDPFLCPDVKKISNYRPNSSLKCKNRFFGKIDGVPKPPEGIFYHYQNNLEGKIRKGPPYNISEYDISILAIRIKIFSHDLMIDLNFNDFSFLGKKRMKNVAVQSIL